MLAKHLRDIGKQSSPYARGMNLDVELLLADVTLVAASLLWRIVRAGAALATVIKITGGLTAAKVSFFLAVSDVHIAWRDTTQVRL